MTAGVYLHIPFCKSRCSYCDFATDVYRDIGAVDRYVDALVKEVNDFDTAGALTDVRAADTIYFGGGTPSMLSAKQVERILKAIDQKFDISNVREITMEMNPATVTPATLAAYRKLGVDRASFGVQTFNDRDLKLLARGHDASDARNTFTMLREAGFDNISFDLIAGLPAQTLEDWKANLDEAIKLSPEHISLYLLEIHAGTPLAEQVRSGRRPIPDEDLAAEMYVTMTETLANEGYGQYEISNFCRPGFESRHNTKYWRLDPVYGFGVSAHSFDGVFRYANERDTARYVEMVETGSGVEVFRKEINAFSESIFLGLRLNEGVDIIKIREEFGIDVESKYADDIARLTGAGLIELSGKRLRLTRKGMLFSNEVFSAFV